MSDTKFVLWLLAQSDQGQVLGNVINDLAVRFRSPSFLPHVTLLPLATRDPSTAERTVSTLAARVSPFSVSIAGIDTEPDYFRFLTLRLANDPALVELREQACQLAGLPVTPFQPHISLMYHGDNPALQSSAREYCLAQPAIAGTERIVLNRLALVDISAAVEQWQVLQALPLANSSL